MGILQVLMVMMAIIIVLRAISNGMIAIGLYMQGQPWSGYADRVADQITLVFLLVMLLLK